MEVNCKFVRGVVTVVVIAITVVLSNDVNLTANVHVLMICDSLTYPACASWINVTFPRLSGNTTNPRFVNASENGIEYNITATLLKGSNLFTENVRILSEKAEDVPIDYVIAFGDGPTVNAALCIADGTGVPALVYSTSRSRSVIYEDSAAIFNPTHRDLAKAVATLIGSHMVHHSFLICEDTLVPDGFIDTLIEGNDDFRINSTQYSVMSMAETDKSLQVELFNIYDEGYRLVIVHSTPAFLKRILRIADTLDYLRSGYAWIVTETALEGEPTENYATTADDRTTTDELYVGLLAVHGYEVDTYGDIFTGMVDIIEHSVAKVDVEDGIEAGFGERRNVKDEIRKIRHDPRMFNSNGSRLTKQFRLLNYVRETSRRPSTWKPVGFITESCLDLDTVVWPGQTIFGPVGTAREHYTITMRPAEPFIFIRGPVYSDEECVGGAACLRLNTTDAHIVKETLENFRSKGLQGNAYYDMFCCDGIVVDILHTLSADVNFDFLLYFHDDNNYGMYQDGKWTGMVGEVYNGVADFMVGAISITSERMAAISFSEPYYYSYFNMISANTERRTSMFAFIQPFDLLVWCLITVTATVTALATSLLEWNSPFGLNPWGRCRQLNYTLGSGLTMVYSIWFGHTVSTQPPKSWPSKVVQNVWASAAIVIVASYTAFLAAYLAGNAYTDTKYSILDTKLTSKRVSVMEGTAVEDFTSVINSGLYDQLPKYYVDDITVALQKLRSKEIELYMDDTPLLEYALSKFDDNCTFKYAAHNFGENAYAFGFPKDSWLKEKVNPLLLNYVELGYVDGLKVRYMGASRQCTAQIINSMEFKFGVEHTEGLFVMLMIAVGLACILLAGEHVMYFLILPRLRRRPSTSLWKKRNLEFISQRLYRAINSEKVQHPATKFVDKVRVHQNRLKNRLLQRTRSVPLNFTTYQPTPGDVFREFTFQNIINRREEMQMHCLMKHQLNNGNFHAIEEVMDGCSNPVFEDDGENEINGTVRSNSNITHYINSELISVNNTDIHHMKGPDIPNNYSDYEFGNSISSEIPVTWKQFNGLRKVKRHETWPAQTPRGSVKRTDNDHQRSASTTEDTEGRMIAPFQVVNEGEMHKCSSCSSIYLADNTGQSAITRSQFGIKDNRVKDDLRNHAMAAYSSHSSIGLDNCAVESLSKEDLLVMWKRSEIELQTKLNRTMYQNHHLRQIIHVIEEAAGNEEVFPRNSARATTM